jgi:hypothetical protein
MDVPKVFLSEIDREAKRIGVTRQTWIKVTLLSVLKKPA